MLLQVGVYVRVCNYSGTHLHTYTPTHLHTTHTHTNTHTHKISTSSSLTLSHTHAHAHNLEISLCLPLPPSSSLACPRPEKGNLDARLARAGDKGGAGNWTRHALGEMELILQDNTHTHTHTQKHTRRPPPGKACFVESSKGRFHMSLLHTDKDALARALAAAPPWQRAFFFYQWV